MQEPQTDNPGCAGDGPSDGPGNSPSDGKDSKTGNTVQAAHVAAAEIHCGSGVSTYNCPVCRKAQILDLDRLQVKIPSACLLTSTLQRPSSDTDALCLFDKDKMIPAVIATGDVRPLPFKLFLGMVSAAFAL